jgi:hypothetical protein
MTDEEAAALGTEALAQVRPGDVVGLGTGQAATAFIRALGAAVKNGMSITGVPTSEASATLARSLGIPIVPEAAALDVAIDGADEVDPNLDLVKGFGGALVREKIVAAAARIVDRVGTQGWIALGVAAGVALAWSVSRRAKPHRADLGPWEGERSRPVDENAVVAS